jgi:hypothetical protein
MENKQEEKKVLVLGIGSQSISSSMAKALIRISDKVALSYGKDNGCWWQKFEKTRKKNSVVL